MEFVREKILLNKLVIVDGIGKCGKSLFLNLITAFEKVEKQDFYGCLEYISYAYKHKKIAKDIAIAILRTEIDTALYNNMIGRNINTRLTDDSSIYKFHTPAKYLQRVLDPDGSIIAKKVFIKEPILVCWAHNLISRSDIIFNAFGEKIDFFYINRRPIDIIYEWDVANYTNRMANDPTEMQYCIKYKNTVLPYIALGWEEEYLSCTVSERSVKMIYSFLKENYQSLISMSALNNIYIFNFECLLTDPFTDIERLKNIIGTCPLPRIMTQVLKNSDCPRKIDNITHQEREKKIRNGISKAYADLLSEMQFMYEEIYKLAVTGC